MTAVEQFWKGLKLTMTEGDMLHAMPYFEQAKEMQKEQKQSDYMRGWNDGYQNKVKNPLNDNPKSE